MPQRPLDPINQTDLLNQILARLRALERANPALPEDAGPLQVMEDGLSLGGITTLDFGAGVRAELKSNGFATVTSVGGNAYTWQSARALTLGTGLRYYTERDGVIEFCRADRSSGDGTTTATIDVLKNGTTIYTTSPEPSVDAGDFVGPERPPDITEFVKGDYFQCDITATGGGTGPLRVTFNLQD